MCMWLLSAASSISWVPAAAHAANMLLSKYELGGTPSYNCHTGLCMKLLATNIFIQSGYTQHAGCNRQTDCVHCRKPDRRDLAAHYSVQSWDASKLPYSMVKVIISESHRM